MRSAPLNYLVTLAIAGILWVVCGIPLANYLGDSVSLAEVTTEVFVRFLRIVLASAAVTGLVGCASWYFYGSRESTLGDMPGARRTWNIWFAIELAAAAGAVASVSLYFAQESFSVSEYLIFVLSASLLTWILFWVSTLLFSPRGVKYCVLGMR